MIAVVDLSHTVYTFQYGKPRKLSTFAEIVEATCSPGLLCSFFVADLAMESMHKRQRDCWRTERHALFERLPSIRRFLMPSFAAGLQPGVFD